MFIKPKSYNTVTCNFNVEVYPQIESIPEENIIGKISCIEVAFNFYYCITALL